MLRLKGGRGCCRRSSLSGPAEFGGAGAGVFLDFGIGGDDGVAAVGGVGAGAEEVAEVVFDGAVFAAVEGDDGGDASGLEDARKGIEERIEIGQLVVDHDAERLKGACGGVELGAHAALDGEVASFADNGHEVLGGGDGLLGAALDDELGDFLCVFFVAELKESVGEILFAHAAEDGGGWFALGWIHAHVERAGLAIGEAAVWVIDLRAGDADVGEDGVDGGFGDFEISEDTGEIPEVGMDDIEADGAVAALNFLEFDAGFDDIGGVEIEGDEAAVWLEAFEDCGRMAPKAQGAIDDGLAGLWGEKLENGLEKDGDVFVALHLVGVGRAGHRTASAAWECAGCTVEMAAKMMLDEH